MQIVPLQPVPSQTVIVALGGQSCSLNVYQRSTGLYCDLSSNGVVILTGVPCLQANKIVRDLYLGFAGDLAFFDTQGTDDPVFSGIGSRWFLFYLEVSDLGGLG